MEDAHDGRGCGRAESWWCSATPTAGAGTPGSGRGGPGCGTVLGKAGRTPAQKIGGGPGELLLGAVPGGVALGAAWLLGPLRRPEVERAARAEVLGRARRQGRGD